jgi:hypothetical protein
MAAILRQAAGWRNGLSRIGFANLTARRATYRASPAAEQKEHLMYKMVF